MNGEKNNAAKGGPVSHLELAQEIRRRILTAQYAPGQRIPPERELLEEFGCSRLTVSRALTPLAAEGLIERHRGRGTFIAGSSLVGHAPPRSGRGSGRPNGRGNVIKYISPGQSMGVCYSRDEVLTGLHDLVDEVGYHVSVDFYGDLEEHARCLKKIRDHQIAGVVLWPLPDPRIDALIRTLLDESLPLVLIDTYLPGVECDYVVGDNIEGAAMMVRHLAAQGHRNICYLTPPTVRTSLRDRLSGFIRGMIEAGLPVGDAHVADVDLACFEKGGEKRLAPVLADLMRRPSPPTAVFASHDVLALSVCAWMEKNGFRVPRQVSVVGYDGIEMGAFASPALTTVEQDFRAMAMDAARILLERFDGRSAGLCHKRFIDPHLAVRASSAPPADA